MMSRFSLLSMGVVLFGSALTYSSAHGQSLISYDQSYAKTSSKSSVNLKALLDVPAPINIGQITLNTVDLKSFYQMVNNETIWIKSGRLTDQARKIVSLLERSNEDGLFPQKYHTDLLKKDFTNVQNHNLQLELLLTDGLIHLVHDLHIGQVDPRRLEGELGAPNVAFDYVRAALDVALSHDPAQALVKYRPEHPHYEAMRDALNFYRNLQTQKKWASISSEGPVLREGDYSPEISIIRYRLQAEQYLPVGKKVAEPDYYDASLEVAIKNFQANNGLIADGIIGKATRYSLSLSVDFLIQTLSVNLERLRWLPWKISDKYLWVNIPSFQLFGVENGETTLQMPVIVGKETRPTPVFKDRIEYIDINPKWNVPVSIIKKDFYKKLIADPSFIQTQNFKIYDGWGNDAYEYQYWEIDWAALTPEQVARYRFVQMPGDMNALGSVKFMFPNKHNVYLHDTNQRSKFNQDIRMISSGCIRVSAPWVLAEFLLPEKDGFTSADWEIPLASQQETIVSLKNYVPIYLSYQTVMINSEARPVFYEDIYGHDQELLHAIRMSENALTVVSQN